ncbi:RHS repeat domain-containing protein [Paenibacillus ferrarius]|uniref:RHS repeat domain-containing protein n=1 Tax=Paenibacillus ferrarius TaxID=1469647 RepID=UPI003D28DB9F
MKKSFLFFCGFFTILIITILFQQRAYADVYGTDAVMNGLITQQQINQTQKPQFSDRNGGSEAIDPVTGALSWKQNNIHLPGREGLDLDVGVMYQSNYAFGYMRYYNGVGNLKKYNYLVSRYDLGIGWSFRFPSVQLQDGYLYYHNGEGSIYRIDFNATGAVESYTHLIGYQGKDLRFVQDMSNTFSNGQANSSYYLEYASKKREYFATDGRLIGIVDRYGNKITFTHQDHQTYDGQTNKVFDTITDTVGRTVKFTYDSNLQTATDTDFNGENIIVTVKDPAGTDNQSITFTKWRSKSTFNGNPDGYQPTLWCITNQVGSTSYFSYVSDPTTNMILSGRFSYYYKSDNSYSGWNSYFLINSISLPHSQVNYQYEKVSRNLGTSGFGEEFRVLSRNDKLANSTQIYNQTNYAYSGDYSGYPTYYDANNLPNSFTFSSTATLQSSTATNGIKTISTFNGSMQPVSTETKAVNGERKVVTNLAFNPTFKYLPSNIQFADYAASDTDATANKLFVNKEYTAWGGLQSQTLPLTQSQLNDASLKSKYTTSYDYEPIYNLLKSKIWYPNVSNSAPSTESYVYDGNGRVVSFTNAKGEVTTTCYDIIDSNAAVTSSCTGGSTPLIGKVQKVMTTKALEGGKTSRSVTTFESATGYAYPGKLETNFNTSNESGQPITQTISTFMTYFMGTGLLKDKTDGANNRTSYVYDSLGRLTETKYPMFTNLNGQQYDVSDIITYGNYYIPSYYDPTNTGIYSMRIYAYRKYTQKSNNAVTYLNQRADYYDGLGNMRLSTFWDPGTSTWKYSQYHYDDLARVTYMADPLMNTTTASYDSWGRQNEVIDVYGNLYEMEYNLKARRTSRYFVASTDVNAYRTNPALNNLKSSYSEQDADQWGQILTTRAYKDWPNQNQPLTESWTYDTMGNVLTYTDPKKNLNSDGVTKKLTYDVLNRLVTFKDALGQLTNYEYDAGGNLKQISMQATLTGTSTVLNTKQFNEVGGLTQKTDPANLSETYTYNNLGQLNTYVDRKGSISSSQFDEQNRLTVSSITANGMTLTSKSIIGSNGIMYDKAETYLNGVTTASMTSGMDTMKRLTSLNITAANYNSSLSLVYDSNSRVTKQTNNLSGYTVNYHYDKLRMDSVQMDGLSTPNTAATANAIYDYYAEGQIKSITYPALIDGTVLKTEYTYNSLKRLDSVTNKKGSIILSSYSYQYDDNGNITSKTETVNTVSSTTSYTYDALNRLLTISRPDGSTASYTYDLKGNRMTLQDNAQNFPMTDISYTYDLLNRLSSVINGSMTTFVCICAQQLAV